LVVESFVESKTYASRPYLSTPKSRTRMRVSRAGLNEVGTLVQPVAAASVT
jgi:hypothetical protein